MMTSCLLEVLLLLLLVAAAVVVAAGRGRACLRMRVAASWRTAWVSTRAGWVLLKQRRKPPCILHVLLQGLYGICPAWAAVLTCSYACTAWWIYLDACKCRHPAALPACCCIVVHVCAAGLGKSFQTVAMLWLYFQKL